VKGMNNPEPLPVGAISRCSLLRFPELPVSPSTAERHCTFVDGAGGEPLGSNPKYPVVRI
jgi:hypothetical protein